METTDHIMREQVGALYLDIKAHMRLDNNEILDFLILDGPNDVTLFVEQMNGELYERLKEKIKAEMIELHKPEGADL